MVRKRVRAQGLRVKVGGLRVRVRVRVKGKGKG
jgi:hypothetical protein